jgi:hypothetical protein
MKATRTLWWPRSLIAILTLLVPLHCSLFEPREPEPPTQSSFDFRPPTVPTIVISNLQNAVAQKNSANYMSCFADPLKTGRAFTFIPSAEASAQYPGLLANWTIADELSYFQNLIAKAPPNGFSSLLLTPKSSVVTADSVIYDFDYTLTFEHTEAGFPTTSRGTLQFSIGTDNTNFWTIYRWSDFKTTTDITWSLVKGKFSN